MNPVGGWLVAPLVLVVITVGMGLLVERVERRPLPGPLLPAVGTAALVVVAGVITINASTAKLAAPACALLAACGYAVTRRRARRPSLRDIGVWAGVGAIAFLLYAAPVVSSGQATIAGYVKLDDSANWLALTDHVMDHGLDVGTHPPSTYQLVLDGWLGGGYPVGAFLPLGVAARSARVDPVDAYQPIVAFYAAVTALALAACARSLVRTRGRAVLVGLIAVQASLLFGYAQWGGIKEVATVALLATLGCLVAEVWERPDVPAPALAILLAAGALLGVLGVNGAVWAAPALVLALAGAVGAAVARRRRVGPRLARPWVRRAVLAAALFVACAPALASIDFVKQTGGVLSASSELGNLERPLRTLQGSGLWLVGDFRDPPAHPLAMNVLALALVAAAAAAIAMAVVDRRLGIPSYALITVAGAVPAIAVGSPWVDAKVLAATAPAVLAAAAALALSTTLGPSRLARGAGVTATALLVVLAGVSSVAVTRSTWAAPRDGFDDLRALAPRIKGGGPTLLLDHDTFADRYFLRGAQTDGATDLRSREIRGNNGTTFPPFSTVEVDDVAPADLFAYRTLVRRRSPSASRPPLAYNRVFAGRVWEAWQRPNGATPARAHLPLGSAVDPGGTVDCSSVTELAATVGAEQITALPEESPIVTELEQAQAPRGWVSADGVRPRTSATMLLQTEVVQPGRYEAWVGGIAFGRLEVVIDGKSLGARRHEVAHGAPWIRFDRTDLAAGTHVVELRYRRGTLAAGSGSSPTPLGPFALSRVRTVAPGVVTVPAGGAADLCDGRAYDWVEFR